MALEVEMGNLYTHVATFLIKHTECLIVGKKRFFLSLLRSHSHRCVTARLTSFLFTSSMDPPLPSHPFITPTPSFHLRTHLLYYPNLNHLQYWDILLPPAEESHTGCFLHWASPKKLKCRKSRLGESTLTCILSQAGFLSQFLHLLQHYQDIQHNLLVEIVSLLSSALRW